MNCCKSAGGAAALFEILWTAEFCNLIRGKKSEGQQSIRDSRRGKQARASNLATFPPRLKS